jgi:ABC-type ATPase involved in cell division
MHNQEGYPGLNQYGEPSETLCQLDAALRRATDGVYGVRDLGTTVLMTTHNKGVVDSVGRRVVTMDKGKIIRDDASGKFSM